MAQQETALTEAQAADRLRDLPGWYIEAGTIRRVYDTDGWRATMLLVNALAFAAEAADHHPDLSVHYKRVVVSLSTHSAGGITDKDMELARKFDEIALWRPSGGALQGSPEAFVKSGKPR